ncbi:5967_t:CDS:1, partial [Funneliformis geosporum]
MDCPTDESGSLPIGMSSELANKTIFTSLNKHYKFFLFGFGPDTTKENRILEITDNPVQYWEHEELIEFFTHLDVF